MILSRKFLAMSEYPKIFIGGSRNGLVTRLSFHQEDRRVQEEYAPTNFLIQEPIALRWLANQQRERGINTPPDVKFYKVHVPRFLIPLLEKVASITDHDGMDGYHATDITSSFVKVQKNKKWQTNVYPLREA